MCAPPLRAKAASRFACHRLPPHSILSGQEPAQSPQRGSCERLAVRVQYLKFVNSVFVIVRVSPDHSFVVCHFYQLGPVRAEVIAGKDGVAVREALPATSVIDQRLRQVLIADFPDDFPFRVNFNDKIAGGAVDKCMAIWQPDRREWPMRGFNFPGYSGVRQFPLASFLVMRLCMWWLVV